MSEVIRLENVSKSFTYWENRSRSIKKILTDFSSFKFNRGKARTIEILTDVNITINAGEFVGIMGRNGVGKSTLLKIISGIYSPTTGKVHINGKIAPLLELGAGFADELSGYENIFLNGAILGFSRSQMADKVKDILEFSELGDKIDMPVRNYSSGMLVRLGFSIACHLEAPILLFDEILAVGDVGFQRKCMEKINKLHQEGRSIILVTHSPDQVRQLCNRCIVFDNKTVIFDGPADKGTEVYLNGFV